MQAHTQTTSSPLVTTDWLAAQLGSPLLPCAARVWWMLRLCGFDNCFVLDGGWRKWCKEGRAVSSEPTCWPPGSFPIRPRPHLLADKQQVQAALGDNKTLLLHALPPPVFSGALKVFARAGRIPGSRNVFVALALVMLGCDNVALYDGSLAEWTADPALPMETDFPQ